MKTAKIFRNGQSQAVRLPKEFRFEGDEVYIKKTGRVVHLIPKWHSWDVLWQSLEKFTPDYLSKRSQPARQKRGRLLL
ncbi:MAG: antitoxin [Acidobacteria bacterium]|nr:antitoxin [Acidobacteriota bacterium]MCI0628606.1 antitoxin [Acidobacteriota bacterium]MCI0721361.1 antitoxin [Acidobacteriota bacterium]